MLLETDTGEEAWPGAEQADSIWGENAATDYVIAHTMQAGREDTGGSQSKCLGAVKEMSGQGFKEGKRKGDKGLVMDYKTEITENITKKTNLGLNLGVRLQRAGRQDTLSHTSLSPMLQTLLLACQQAY